MADGYVRCLPPFLSADVAAVTLSTTDKALIPLSNIPIIGGNYFNYIGKALEIFLFGRMTTVLTPGNGTMKLYYGTGADANGTVLAASAALALTASQTNLSWYARFLVRCRAMGASGSLFVTGEWGANVGVLASTLQPAMIPASAPAAVSVDLTAASILSPQFNRSGSTAETMQVHDVLFKEWN